MNQKQTNNFTELDLTAEEILNLPKNKIEELESERKENINRGFR